MRDIKFRGFEPISKKFIYGNLLFTNETYYIIPFLTNGCMSQKEMMLRWISPCYQVISETVGQYTGLKDKNSVEIYEGDIVKNTYGKLEKVVFVNGSFQCASINHPSLNLYLLDTYSNHIEVVGNIHEWSEDNDK